LLRVVVNKSETQSATRKKCAPTKMRESKNGLRFAKNVDFGLMRKLPNSPRGMVKPWILMVSIQSCPKSGRVFRQIDLYDALNPGYGCGPAIYLIQLGSLFIEADDRGREPVPTAGSAIACFFLRAMSSAA
jgi:hypothetical protein